jgi:hypothetical protein
LFTCAVAFGSMSANLQTTARDHDLPPAFL